ncbi:MAG TPA: hypothetical protein VFB95_03720 [Candidatus Cryosericum sp.]|nr:hypothetical protein [Candidatus Cryosericum sp.]
MKRFAAAFAVVALMAAPVAFACDKHKDTQSAQFGKGPIKDVVLTGYLTDSNCGAANANAEGKDCALHCIKKGAKVQLKADNKLYTIEKLDKPEEVFGFEVKVTGQLDESSNVVRVASIEKLTKS